MNANGFEIRMREVPGIIAVTGIGYVIGFVAKKKIRE
jgi:hypothetical protein